MPVRHISLVRLYFLSLQVDFDDSICFYKIFSMQIIRQRLSFLSRTESDYTAVPTEANECQNPETDNGMSSVWHRLASVGADL